MSEALQNWLARVKPTGLFTDEEISALTPEEIAQLEVTAESFWDSYWASFRADTKRYQELH